MIQIASAQGFTARFRSPVRNDLKPVLAARQNVAPRHSIEIERRTCANGARRPSSPRLRPGRKTMPFMCRLIAGSLLAVALQCSPAAAQDPNKPVTVIVPFAAGGPTDVVTRLVGDHMSRTLGQTLVVENVGGAGGTLGMTRAAQAQPDGYTIAVGNMGTQSAAPALYPNLKYDPAKSFAQVGIVNYTPQAIVAKKATAAKDLKEFIRYLKAKDSKLNYGHAGVGSIAH